MKQLASIILLVCSFLVFTSCAIQQPPEVANAAPEKQPEPLTGHHFEATVGETAAKTLFSAIMRSQMSKYDRQQLNHVFDRGASGSSSAWINPDNGNRYGVTPGSAYADPASNQYCRKARIIALIGGKEEITESTACRLENGQWQLR